MKTTNKVIIAIGIVTFLIGIMTTGCQSSATKVENAKIKMEDSKDDFIAASQELEKAHKDSVAEYQKFKSESNAKIKEHEKTISEFKARIATEETKNKLEYEKKIAVLEQKNTDMKKSLQDYKADGKEKWDAFKTKFNHDMGELGKAFKGFVVN